MRGELARRDVPELPVVAEPLELAVTADAGEAAVVDVIGHLVAHRLHHLLCRREPAGIVPSALSAKGLRINFGMRQEAMELLISMHVALLEPEILGPRSAVGDENG